MSKLPPLYCPKCNGRDTMEMISERKGGFSGGKAAVGAVLFGPVGLVGGALGKKKVTYECSNCGYLVER